MMREVLRTVGVLPRRWLGALFLIAAGCYPNRAQARTRWHVRRMGWAIALAGGSLAVAAPPAPTDALPDPLTLEVALQYADQPHPILQAQQVAVDLERARLAAVRAQRGLNAYLDVVPRTSDPAADPTHDYVNDSFAVVSLSKELYDFGRTRSLTDSAEARIAGQQLLLVDVRQQRRLEIMQRYLDVILADLRFLADDEEMARRYVRFDDARERRELGEISDLDVIQLETAYREALNRRAQSETRQRLTRQLLATALNRPDALPGQLTRPRLKNLDRTTPDPARAVEQALKTNARLRALRAEVEAARSTLLAEQAARRPVLSASFEAAALEREVGSRNEGVLGLKLRVPIYQGGADAAAIAGADALLRAKQARLHNAELATRTLVLELLHELDTLRVRRKTAQVREDYRDLAVDRARALYELEVRTNLGQSMARLTEAQWLSARVEFATAVTWARLEAVMGQVDTLGTDRAGQ